MTTITTLEVSGTMQGPIWWPIGEPCQKPYHASIVSETRPAMLADIVDLIENELSSDGDFSDMPLLTADTVIEIRRQSHNVRTNEKVIRSRLYSVIDWPSLSAIVDPDAWTFYDD